MLHHTKGIVLRAIKYGDTSLVLSIYTELFGVQSYLVNGVRTDKKASVKANMYQPTSLLNLVVYHTPNKNLQRIKEVRVHHLYKSLQQSFIKNTIAIYITELIQKTISEPETNLALYSFFEETFIKIDHSADTELANLPIEFTLDLAAILGFGFQNRYSEEENHLDLANGIFCDFSNLKSLQFISGEIAMSLSQIAHHQALSMSLNQTKRHELLNFALQYIRIHIPHLSELKSVAVLHVIMS